MVSGTTVLILDDADNAKVGAETSARLKTADASVVSRGVGHRLNVLEPDRLLHATPAQEATTDPADQAKHLRCDQFDAPRARVGPVLLKLSPAAR